MRTFLTTLALAAGMSLMAQDADTDNDKKSPEEKAKQRTEQMTKQLGLSAEQVAKVNTLHINHYRAMSDVKALEDKEVKRGRLEALKAKRDADLKAILTEEQYNKLVALREKKKEGKEKETAKPHNE